MCSIILMLIIYTDVVTSPLYHQSVQYPQLMFLLCYLLTIYLTIPSNPSTLLLLDMLFCYPWPKVCHHLMLSIPLSCFSVCHWWVNSFRIFFFSLIFTEHNIFQFYPGNLSLLTFLTATYYSFVCVYNATTSLPLHLPIGHLGYFHIHLLYTASDFWGRS